MLKTSTPFAAGVLFAEPVRAAALPPSALKLLKSGPSAAMLAQREEIKARYAKMFKV